MIPELLIIPGLLATPVQYETDALDPAPLFSVQPGDGDCDALIFVTNPVGWYNFTVPLDTPVGTVEMRYKTIGNAVDMPDEAEVHSMPPDVYAYPIWQRVPEDTTVEICLRKKEYEGS